MDCSTQNGGFELAMEVLYGLVVTIGIIANALVCCVFINDIRMKNVNKHTEGVRFVIFCVHKCLVDTESTLKLDEIG